MRAAVSELRQAGILASLFIDPDPRQIEAAHEVGAQQVELCTAVYAEATLGARGIHGEGARSAAKELRRLRDGAELAAQYGLRVAAGHGLTYRNVGAVAAIPEITEFNIGHNIISRSILVGLERAVREMREVIAGGNTAMERGRILFEAGVQPGSSDLLISENRKGRPRVDALQIYLTCSLLFPVASCTRTCARSKSTRACSSSSSVPVQRT